MNLTKIENVNGQNNFGTCSSFYKGKKIVAEYEVNTLIADYYMETKNIKFDKPRTYTFYICYPLSVCVKANATAEDLYGLIKNIKRAYRKIYRDPKQYGIWGHGITDLFLPRIQITEDNLVNVLVES